MVIEEVAHSAKRWHSPACEGGHAGWPLGFSLVNPSSEVLGLAAEDGLPELTRCYVRSDYRGIGAAQMLLQATLANLSPPIGLMVNDQNARAIRFYRRNGFWAQGFETVLALNPSAWATGQGPTAAGAGDAWTLAPKNWLATLAPPWHQCAFIPFAGASPGASTPGRTTRAMPSRSAALNTPPPW